MPVKLSNNAAGRLATNITASVTAITLQAGNGSTFPALNTGEWFPLTVYRADSTLEIMRVTARSGDILTVVRGQEGTQPKAFEVGDRAELRLTAGVLNTEFAQQIAAAATAAGTAVTPSGKIAATNVQGALIGLNQVDNTADASKPVSTAQAAAIKNVALVVGPVNRDPNTADDHVILTNHANTPDPTYYWHITTTFYTAVSSSSNRAQIAVQYGTANKVYARGSLGAAWSAWVRLDTERGPAGDVVVRTNYGYLRAGPLSADLCHFDTDRPTFYFYKPISIQGYTVYHSGNLPVFGTRWPTFAEVTGKPATFAPSAHTHTWAQIVDAPAYATRWPSWWEITGKPATFMPGTAEAGWAIAAMEFWAIGSYGMASATSSSGNLINGGLYGEASFDFNTRPAVGYYRVMGVASSVTDYQSTPPITTTTYLLLRIG